MSTRTRSGRIVKNPKVFIPAETVLDDDYCTEDHDDTGTESDIATDDEYRSSSDDDDSEDDEDDDEVDEDGNLKDFIDDASEESESDDA